MTAVLVKLFGQNAFEAAIRAGSIEMVPLETIRGSSYDDTIVLVDEAQNLSYEEVKAITTRLGEGSKMVLMGDPMQRDINNSGLTTFSNIVQRYHLDLPVIHFDVSHIVRSDIVATLVKTYLDYEKETPRGT
jgi:phosphate starvation-inducible PhoH-like protein